MWNLEKKKRKKIDECSESSKHIRTKRSLRDNAGFTLVELLVAVTVLSVMVVPLTSAFMVSARLNTKGRQQEQAMTIAQNLMEGVKYFGLESLAEQVCTDTFTIVSNGSDSSTRAIKGTDKSGSYDSTNGFVTNTNGNNGNTVSVSYTDADGNAASEDVGVAEYEYYIEDILMGSTYYDAKIVIEQSTDTTYLVAQTSYYKAYFTGVAMKSLKYYNVTIDVYLSDDVEGTINEDGHRATYTGSFTDKS